MNNEKRTMKNEQFAGSSSLIHHRSFFVVHFFFQDYPGAFLAGKMM
jgi:hypothetical protein